MQLIGGWLGLVVGLQPSDPIGSSQGEDLQLLFIGCCLGRLVAFNGGTDVPSCFADPGYKKETQHLGKR